MTRIAPSLCLLVGLAACGPDEGETDTGALPSDPITVAGRVDKGPFVLGSSIQLYAADEEGVPTGLVFQSQTVDDLGSFDVTVRDASSVRLVAQGFYYNEISGSLSTAPITLRGHFALGSDEEQTANVNVVTHLGASRVETLLDDGLSLTEAIAQSEQELRAALAIGPTTGASEGLGTDLSLLGEDPTSSAWLLAVSSVLAQAAAQRGGSVDANLTALVNGIQADLAADGLLASEATAELEAAEGALDGDAVMASMADYLDSLGSTAAVPDIHLGLDSDHDGVSNANDLCRYIADPGQEDVDGDGFGDACEYTFRRLEPGGGGVMGLLENGLVIVFPPDAPPSPDKRFVSVNPYWYTDPVRDFDGNCVITADGGLRCIPMSAAITDDFVEIRIGDRQEAGVCARRANGTIACFDQTGNAQSTPSGAFRDVDPVTALPYYSTLDVACAVADSTGVIECWYRHAADAAYVDADMPTEAVHGLDVFFNEYEQEKLKGCAIRESDSSLACWGQFIDPIPTGTGFVDVSLWRSVACASRASAGPVCWQINNVYNDPSVLDRTPPSTVLHGTVATGQWACGLDEDSYAHCW